MTASAAYVRFQEDTRPEPEQIIDFTVEVENITVQAGLCEVQFNGFYRLYCRWNRNVIDVQTIEAKVWRGSFPIWLIVDPRTELGAQILLEHFASPAGQKQLALDCDDQETNRRDDE